MGFDPETFGTEVEYLASELPGQMGNRILISLYGLTIEASKGLGICIEFIRPSPSIAARSATRVKLVRSFVALGSKMAAPLEAVRIQM